LFFAIMLNLDKMGQAISITIRHQLVEANEKGQSYLQLSKQYKLSYNTVRNLCISYKRNGLSGLSTNYSNCGNKGVIRSDSFIYRCSIWLKRLHPSWGADTIRAKLSLRYPDKKLPNSRTMHQWFVNKGLIVKKRNFSLIKDNGRKRFIKSGK